MDPKLKGFFDVVRDRPGQRPAISDAERLAALAECRHKNKRQLTAEINSELGVILDALRRLPEQNGKIFTAEIKDDSHENSAQAHYAITIAYRKRGEKPDFDDYCCEGNSYTQPEIRVLAMLEGGDLRFCITQYSLVEQVTDGQTAHRFARAQDFESTRQQIAFGLTKFAPERLPEIEAALGAPSAPDSKIGIFKPIALRERRHAMMPSAKV